MLRATLRASNLCLNRMIAGALVARQPIGGFMLGGIGSTAGGEE